MPDKRQHRGPHPEDGELFARERWGELQSATHDLSWLLSRGYALPSSLKIVGDRYGLTERQRLAVMRSSCSDASLELRCANCVSLERVAGSSLLIDGYNLLTTIEAALGGAVLLHGRDYCLRDLASMHGHYKRVAETGPALEIIGRTLVDLRVMRACFLLDAPVSNSGRLKKMMEEIAGERGWAWEVRLLPDPDPELAKSGEVIVTADSVILDGARNPAGHAAPRWCNLALHGVRTHVAEARIVPMRG
ncbi:MAG: DUF434 domain-containing protein [Phycisphaerae bacterium]